MRREPKFRSVTRKSITKLSYIFKVQDSEFMQDWEWVIADHRRINEYIQLYLKMHMTDDDRFGIMETIIQSVEDLYSRNGFPPKQWSIVKKLLKRNKELHQYTVFYWSCLDWYTVSAQESTSILPTRA
jgi:hypothetical protein